ncbi:MAG: hypothetical protein IKO75_12935 [Bacteroidales bacterium]|jgi:hypothetical protein|nr:hypothetical protein [Bacteroidales bacterium]
MDDSLCKLLITKGELKQSIFTVTLETMQLFKDAAKSFEEHYRDNYADDHDSIPVLFTNKNQYQFMLKFGGDVLIFLMHTNIFEFSRDHEVMRTPYIKEDKDRSYCGMIQIFNFLGDSLKYDRVNDLGYMIGRIFINKEGHYYIEGKRELAQVINNFSSNEISADAVKEILSSAIRYTLNFDLLVPNYEDMKIITVNDILQLEEQTNLLRTGKRLGFRFEQDKNE